MRVRRVVELRAGDAGMRAGRDGLVPMERVWVRVLPAEEGSVGVRS